MTIDKAILILSASAYGGVTTFDPDFKDALKLSIEALKLLAEQPPEGYTCIPRPLPGETEE